MRATVSLKELTDALEALSDNLHQLLDRETGEVHVISSEVLSLAEEDAPPDELLDDDEEFEMARRAVTSDSFVRLPSKFDVHEWAIMEEFSESQENPQAREALRSAIHGKGAFRCFKDTIHRFRIEQDWYDYRTAALREIAIDWCEENGVPYRED